MFVRELARKAHEVEAAGGMYLEKEERRRTLGGVLFVFARDTVDKDEWAEIDPRKNGRSAGSRCTPSP
ncbi:MAG TPA: hypothetical protein VNO21_23385 [Polyangiaceae bacterium]|nr:hypothetical protein [Polyangiaceae bacterium]